jgi:hypothetical protein
MQPFIKAARGLSSPVILIVAVWCALLLGVAFGPIDYPSQPSASVLALVAFGLSLFVLAHRGGTWCFDAWLQRGPNLFAPSVRSLSIAVGTTSVLGLAGIGLMALDRLVLSGIGNGSYAELLRCAPDLVSVIEVKRTPLLYLGYLTFSFGFASLVLFILKGEEIRGLAAILGQLSIVTPVVYAMLYSGRMPILFVILLVVAAALVRIGQGRPPLPRSHHLLIKLAVVFVLFGIYSSAMWASRQSFCVEMSGLIRELQEKMKQRDLERIAAIRTMQAPFKPAISSEERPVAQAPTEPVKSEGAEPPPRATITATEVSKMIDEVRASPVVEPQKVIAPRKHPDGVATLLITMQQAWHVKPRGYVMSAIDSDYLPPGAAALLSTYFYLTHGVGILDTMWHAREQISPLWGTYQIGVLSPILRVFFPQNTLVDTMTMQLKSAGIYGFFPTVWGAAYIDFGAAGAILYVLVWGFAAGWSSTGARRTALLLPALLQTFILASIMLSPVQGPLGVANSALVLVAVLIVGLAVDVASLGSAAQPAHEPKVSPSA